MEILNGLKVITDVDVPWQYPVTEDFHVLVYKEDFL